MNLENYKFLDVGCKTGNSFKYASKFGYKSDQGIGIDIDKNHIEKMNQNGNVAIFGNATKIPFPDKSFNLVIFSHVIEHMDNEEMGKLALSECLRVCSEFLLIALPFFDEDEYLNSLGFKTYYSDWDWHPNKVHLKTLTTEWLADYKLEVNMLKKITDSSFPEILPIKAKKNSKEYNPKLHGPKENVVFTKDIWREYMITVHK